MLKRSILPGGRAGWFSADAPDNNIKTTNAIHAHRGSPQGTIHYHHSIERVEGVFRSGSGFWERRSSSGHCTSLTTFSAIEPNISGCHPDIPCVEITTRSIFSRSTTSIMFPDTSLPTSTLLVVLIPFLVRMAWHFARCRSA